MTRRAVEQFTTEPPAIPVGVHPYDGEGMLIGHSGSLTVYMSLAAPGRYYADMACKRPASDEQARAAFGNEAFDRYRIAAQERLAEAKIEEALAAPEREAEDLKEKVRRLSARVRTEALLQKQLAASDDYTVKVRAAAQS